MVERILGRLMEATSLIQRALQGADGPGADGAGAAKPDAPEPKSASNKPHRTRPHASLRETVVRMAALTKMLREEDSAHPAAEPVPKGASFAVQSYKNAAGSRDYKLYVPAKAAAKRPALIVMLHGCSQNPDDFAAGTRMNALAEEHGFLVAYPRQNMTANIRQCWNWFRPEDQRRDAGEPSLIAGITRDIIKEHGVDPARVYIAGLSAGGAAAAIMGDAYPDLYAAVGVHSGLPSASASDMASAFDAMRVGVKVASSSEALTRTVVFHGDRDRIVHPANGEAVAAKAVGSARGLKRQTEEGKSAGGRPYTRISYLDHAGRSVCEYWRLPESGHAWAGGSPEGSHTDPLGPDASREMVRFFFQ